MGSYKPQKNSADPIVVAKYVSLLPPQRTLAGLGVLVKLLLLSILSVIGFCVEGGEAGMVQAIAADEIDHEKH
jgi:hypothetical protein